ncbi:flagellar hook-basal body protein [Bacillus infantis]|jgi:flagellar basal-body rod protein FlgG|uniref:flagellar hook-basal body protein n=1 Tax=Bacillus infantis TaxID=324767 RepID=UPI003CF4207C
MSRIMITAANTMAQLQKQMDITSHNMANIDTVGYKRREASFSDLMVQQFANQPNSPDENRLTPDGLRMGTGAMLAQSQAVMNQGSIKETGRQLDTAFTKENQLYKVLVRTEAGTAVQYTRDGAFYLTPVSETESMLVTGAGHAVLDENDNPIYINSQSGEFRITENGILAAMDGNGNEQTFSLGIVQVNKPQFLEQQGGNLFALAAGAAGNEVMTDLSGALRGQAAVQQRALEQSNVDMQKEMTDLISTQRAYQFQSRAISMADQMMGLVNGIR